MDTKLCWIWLSLALKENSGRFVDLWDYFKDVQSIYNADEKTLTQSCELSDKELSALSNKSLKKAQDIVRYCESNAIGIVCFGDSKYPNRLKNIYAPPIVFFYRGILPDIDSNLLITLVGSRKYSAYGQKMTEKLSYDLTRAGAIVVSGMALGIDTAANMGALKAGGKTIAVLGCGVDVCYPKTNEQLMQRIVENGAVISEFPPQTPPNGANFPIRNRIMSALSVGVVVCEAPIKSGALITVNHALDQGRDTFAIPGNIDSLYSEGANELIKRGEAKLITNAGDILEEYREFFADKIDAQIAQDETASEFNVKENLKNPPGLSKNEELVFNVLKKGQKHIDEIALETGIEMAQLNAALSMLELNSYIEGLSNKYYRLP